MYQDYYTTSLHTLKTKLLGLRTPRLVSVHSFGPQFQSAVFERGARAKPLGGDEARAAACSGCHPIKGSGALGGAPRHPRRRPRRSGNPKLKSGVPRAVRGAGAQANEWGWSPRSNAFRAPFNQVQGSGGRVALQSAAAPLPRRDTHAEILNSKEDPRENLWLACPAGGGKQRRMCAAARRLQRTNLSRERSNLSRDPFAVVRVVAHQPRQPIAIFKSEIRVVKNVSCPSFKTCGVLERFTQNIEKVDGRSLSFCTV